MTRIAVKVAIAIAMLAVASYYVWDRTYSHSAQLAWWGLQPDCRAKVT